MITLKLHQSHVAVTLFLLLGSSLQEAPAQCETAKLYSLQGQSLDFGASVAISADFVVVGDPFEVVDDQPRAGAAYVFHRTINGWDEVARLTSSDAFLHYLDEFGYSAAVDGNTILIGAPYDDYPERRGAVFVFEFDGLAWLPTQKLTPSLTLNPAEFGVSVALEEDRALIGATLSNGVAGAAYIFERTAGLWNEVATLTASDAGYADYFGRAVSLSGNLALVGAPGDDSSTGSAYVYDQSLGWAEVAKLVPGDPDPAKDFGWSVALNGVTAAIGASRDDALGESSGAAYVFEQVLNVWSELTKIVAIDGHAGHGFGDSLSMSADTLVVGAAGAAYLYRKETNSWAFQAKLSSVENGEVVPLPSSLAIEGETIILGAMDGDGLANGTGAAYIFEMPAAVTAYCFGIGCPCNNDDPVQGCGNSVGWNGFNDPLGALLAACGSASVADDDLVLTLSHLPPNQFSLFYMGGGDLQAPFGDGLRCVGAGGAGLFRYNPPEHSGSAGMLTLGPGVVARSQSFPANGHIDAGETWYFQGWYRDPMGPCGTAFNLSNGLAVTFAP